VQDGKVTKLDITEKDFSTVDDVVQTLESFNTSDINDQSVNQHNLQVLSILRSTELILRG
jgi:hypothetical protein